jgi:hypothetical protein
LLLAWWWPWAPEDGISSARFAAKQPSWHTSKGRRSRILEDINGSLPLAEIIEHITELVSFKLHGAPCWCQIADGALLGNCPPKLTDLRIVRQEIPSRSGPPLGELFAAFDPLTKPTAAESETLSLRRPPWPHWPSKPAGFTRT